MAQRKSPAYTGRRCRLFHLLGLLLSGILLLPAQTFSSPQTPAGKEAHALEPGKPVARELAANETHSYQVMLAPGDYLRVLVNQLGVDVVVAAFAPDGAKIVESNSDNGNFGPEPASLIATSAGAYRIEVRPLDNKSRAGRYEIKIDQLRPATPREEKRVAAERVFLEADRLRGQDTPAALRTAMEKYQEAVALLEQIGDPFIEGQALHGIGRIYNVLGDKLKALEYYDKALPHRRAAGDRRGEATTLNSIGTIYIGLGEYQKALDAFLRALPLRREAGDLRGEAITLNNIGYIYSDLGEYQRALEYYKQVLPLRRAAADRGGEATSLQNIGVTYQNLGDYQKALEYLEQMMAIRKEIGDRRSESNGLAALGGVYKALGENQKALTCFSQALAIDRETGNRFHEIISLRALGQVYFALGDMQKAAESFNQALTMSRAMGLKMAEATVLGHLAQVERRLGNPARAFEHIETALPIIESYRAKIGVEELRASYFATKQRYYELRIDLLMQMHKVDPSKGYEAAALQASERARARTLLDTLTEARADIRQGVDPKLLERERALEKQLNDAADRLARLLSSKRPAEQADAARRELEACQTELQEVEAQIRAVSPRYAALTQPAPLSLTQIRQQVLDADTLLLEYALGDERSFLWAVTPTSITSHELPRRADVEAAARQVYDLLTARNQRVKFETVAERRDRIAKADAEYARTAPALSRMLLGPVAAQMGKKRLLIVSDGALQYLPFAALPDPASPKEFLPLALRHEIVNLPSASILAVMRQELRGRAPAPQAVAILADPVFDISDERLRTARTGKNSNGQFAAVTRTRSEAASVDDDLLRAAREAGTVDAESRLPRLPFTRRE
ncbi:MAG TPA: tetratricopeptide repeat protein, partial [Blastocatellia bacterium]|nr:tetratricopeptide repeat protein [Blastocatellia bacterium]